MKIMCQSAGTPHTHTHTTLHIHTVVRSISVNGPQSAPSRRKSMVCSEEAALLSVSHVKFKPCWNWPYSSPSLSLYILLIMNIVRNQLIEVIKVFPNSSEVKKIEVKLC